MDTEKDGSMWALEPKPASQATWDNLSSPATAAIDRFNNAHLRFPAREEEIRD